MLEENSDGLVATELGIALFSEKGWNQYLEDEATLWLIHWLLATNFDTCTASYWFFNCFHKTEFTQEEAVECDDVMGFTLFYPSYGLRYSWLTKGFQAFTKNPEIFSSDEATIDLGVEIEGQCHQILVAGDLNA